jgi:hypothetical protein
VRILDERREALVERERELLERLGAFLQDFGAPPEDVGLVQRAHQDLEVLATHRRSRRFAPLWTAAYVRPSA